LAAQITFVVDRLDMAPPDRLTKTIRREMKRRATVEPVIGHVMPFPPSFCDQANKKQLAGVC